MTELPGLFELPGRPASPSPRASVGRGRRGEGWIRTVVADLHVVDARALRDAARDRLSAATVVELGPVGPEEDDLLDPYEEILTSNAAAVRWWIEPTEGLWPQLAEALRIEAVDLDANDEGPRQVRVVWAVTVRIADVHLVRRHARNPGELPGPSGGSFADDLNRAAEPYAPLAGLPGVIWTPTGVEVARGGSR
ncbi:MAG TPA: hypothetical protein VM367_18905 [Pseudonocardia sp.]|nr:hypothetical protein [Pseudonocardia sp.]